MRDPRQIPELLGDLRGLIPERAGDLAGIIPESAGDFSGISLRIFRSEEARLETCLRLSASPAGFVAFQFENSKMGVRHNIALRMMARIAQKKQGSSVARNVVPPRHIKNLRAAEEIFLLSVALEAFTSHAGILCAQPQPCNRGEHEGHEGHKERIAIQLAPPNSQRFSFVSFVTFVFTEHSRRRCFLARSTGRQRFT